MDTFKEQWMEQTIKTNADKLSNIDKRVVELRGQILSLQAEVKKLTYAYELQSERKAKDLVTLAKDVTIALISVFGGIVVASISGIFGLFK